MRMPRMKVPEGTDGIYHCYSRVVDGKFIFGRREKEQFLKMIWHIGDFLGIQVLDYVVMSNHYHQIVFVPGIVELSNEQLLERLRVYYGQTSALCGKCKNPDVSQTDRSDEGPQSCYSPLEDS